MEKASRKGPLEERLQSTAVIGAAGKMGSGIAWVALQAMAAMDARRNGSPGSGDFDLVLIDRGREGFPRLKEYLRGQLVKFAERKISNLREWTADRRDLIENGEIIDAYVDGAMSMVRCESEPEAARGAKLVFEAVFEDLEVKKDLYSRLKAVCDPDAYYLTNTSSIPISLLDSAAGLHGKILGYHFYNPPAVQKLVEVIPPASIDPKLTAFGNELGATLEKTLVLSGDVAGFIGNGHFIREGLFAFWKFAELREEFGDAGALYIVNRVTQDFLVRPMGIFQLIDYVGLDVFGMILKVMAGHIKDESFACGELERFAAAGVKGGQIGSGDQKDGLFHYERNKPASVYDLGAGAYVSLIDKGRFDKASAWIGPLPEGHVPWSVLARDPSRKARLAAYFANLAKLETPGAALARAFLNRSREAASALVHAGVAQSDEDVSKVLLNGFFHLYGPADWKP
jgi:3-hydroxyacyl-CoA dehydrogenase